MGLPCKHMFAARRAKKLQMFSENCIAPRWFKETVQKNHCVFLTKEQHDSHIKFAKLKDKPLTHIEKYRRANRLVQHLSDLAAEGGSSQFECRMRVLQNLASIWGSNNEAMVTSIQHHFVDFNIQNGCSKLEIEDDIFRSELRERKFEMTDSSEEVVEVVNVEKNDKSNFHPNSRFERPGCSGEVESNTVQNSIFERPGCSGEVESNTVQNSIFERPGCSGEVESNTVQNSIFERPGCSGEVESNTVQNSIFERPGCSGEVESNTIQNFTVSCEGIIEVRKETEKQIKEIISLNQMDCLSKSKNLLCETSKIPESQLDLSQIHFPSKFISRGRPKSKGKKNAVGLRKVSKICLPYEQKTVKEKVHLLLRRLLKGGRPKDVTVVTPADIADLNLEAKDLPSALMNEIVVLEILKPFLTKQAWKILRASFLRRKKMKTWNCPICLLNAPTESIECSSCLEWYHFNCVKVTSKITKNWYCGTCLLNVET
nr:uncharacterized protein LOC105845514 [Hydra vulgaris]